MKRIVLLSLAGVVVLAGSAAAAVAVLQDDVEVSASCVPIMDTDRDRAGLVDHIAVVTTGKRSETRRTAEGEQQATLNVKVEEVLKGHLPASIPIDQIVEHDSGGARYEQQSLVPGGHRYVIGVYNWTTDTGATTLGRGAFFATSADGTTQLQAARTRWQDAIAHQNPPRTDPTCSDVVMP
ncbi:hypothetical protein ACGFRB_28995 [Streptomyces sp. NPDC048718]|uniref:hypothetical protein n=1 Tax=Streptomyces sp. NPDC048718 TaxID=3365587 RepID=UPI003716CFF3